MTFTSTWSFEDRTERNDDMTIREFTVTVSHEPGRPGLPWLARWREYVPGRKPRKRARSFATKREADQFKADTETLANAAPVDDDDTTAPAKRGTVAAYLTDWLRTEVKPKREAATYRSYEQLVRIHITPHIGAWKLADITRPKIKGFYEDLYDGGAKLPTRKHVHSCLSSAFGVAVEDEVLDVNPCHNLGKRIRHKDEAELDPEPHPFTPAEAAAFLDQVEACEREWLEFFQFLHDTGVRPGECAALKWPCVDLDTKRAKIELSYSPSDEKDKVPKTHQRRWVDLTDVLVRMLTELRQRQRLDSLKAGRTVPAYVFTNGRGSPRRQDGNMRRVFDRTLTATQIGEGNTKRHTPYNFRDTFATTHLNRDYRRLPWVSKQLGHETERTTVEYYFKHLSDEVTKQFANGIRG
jgi:integrase